jgi:predicted PurR-regulated permease PerM
VIVPRWVQLVALPLLVLAGWAVARAAGPVLLIFAVAAVVALILNPLVTVLHRAHLRRGLAVLAVYLGFVVLVGGLVALLAAPVADQATAVQRDVPRLVRDANHRLSDLQDFFDRKGIDIHVKRQGATAVQTVAEKLTKSTGSIASTATDLLRSAVTAGFGLVLVLVLSVYMLIYGDRIGALARHVMPRGDGTASDDFPTRVQHAVSGYVRGQLLFSVLMGTGCGVGMYLLGVLGVFPSGRSYALAFGVFFGLMELVPYVGPLLGALPPLLVALFTDPVDVIWVGLFFVALQQLEGHVVAPQIFGHTLRINPLLVIFALLLGAEVAGIVGALIALPIAAIVRETVLHLRRHLVLEPWGTASPLAAIGVAEPGCPQCGAHPARDDAYCRTCGASLTPPLD